MAKSGSDYKGRLALITGGSSGIGLALARKLSEQGANVWLLARHKDTLQPALDSLVCEGGQKHGILAANVADWEQVRAAIQQLTTEAGVPDLLINSAGVTEPGYIDEIPIETFREIMEINYLGTVHVTKACLPGMMQRGSGDIVNISSAGGFVTGPGYGAYSPSKFAVRGFSDALRAEAKPHGVRVFLVYPPNTETPQRAYEVSHQTPEIHYLDEHAGLGPFHFGTLAVDRVASDILTGMRKGNYVILPGKGNATLYHFVRLLGGMVYSITDDEWKMARKNQNKP
ncbi:MAG: SDR family NAD(P)-dependent oxidoreductase [Anaerolineae bacterium]